VEPLFKKKKPVQKKKTKKIDVIDLDEEPPLKKRKPPPKEKSIPNLKEIGTPPAEHKGDNKGGVKQ